MIFPFEPRFDRSRFRDDVERARRHDGGDNELDDFLRDRGLRYVIEARPSMTVDDVAGVVREVVHEAFVVEPLFEDPEVPESLRGFHLAWLPGLLPQALTQSPYEPAYALLSAADFVSVEPDLPFTGFASIAAGYSVPPAQLPQSVSVVDDKAWSLRNIRADLAWPLFSPDEGGEGVAVAHLDTGWTDHVDLDKANFDLQRAKDYITAGGNAHDPLGYLGNPGHGTRTASVILSRGGVTNTIPPGTSGPGRVTGVARRATYVPVRCVKVVVLIFSGDVAKAIRHATRSRCDVVSMSLGGRPMRAMERALRNAVQNDLIVVAAAGNRVKTVVWPARYPDAISVAASNSADGHWSGSSRGKHVDLSAPGEDVWKADPDPAGTAVSRGDGTSYATANVAGAAALWVSYHGSGASKTAAVNQGLPVQEVFRSCARRSARVPSTWNTKYGVGILDVHALLQQAPGNAVQGHAAPVATSTPLVDVLGDDAQGIEDVAYLLDVPQDQVGDVVDVFGHELTNLLLDREDVLDRARNAVVQGDFRAARVVRDEILAMASATLRHALGRRR